MESCPYSIENSVTDPNMFLGYHYEMMKKIARGVVAPKEERRSFRVIGGRFMGKSSLLRQVEFELKQQAANSDPDQIIIPLYLDVLEFDAKIFFGVVGGMLHTHLKNHSGLPAINGLFNEVKQLLQNVQTSKNQFNSFVEAFTKLVRGAVDPDKLRMVLLIDNPLRQQRPEEAKALCRNLHHLHQNEPLLRNAITYVIAESFDMMRNDQSGGSYLHKIGFRHPLRVFDEANTLKLINDPTQGQVDQKIAGYIYEESGGHPYLIQYIMSCLCELEKQWGQVTEDDVLQVTEQYDDLLGGFEDWWEKWNKPTKKIYEKLCQLDDQYPDDPKARLMSISDLHRELGISVGECKGSLYVLSTAGLIRRDEDNFYEIAGKWPKRKFLQTR